MMESYKNENLEIIREHHSQAHSKIAGCGGDIAIDIIKSKSSGSVPEISIEGRKVLLHSRFDPVKEAERFIAEIEPEKFDLLIIMGFAFAYHIEILLKKIKNDATVLVIEKNPAIIKKAAESRGLSAVLKDDRLKILVDPDEDEIAETLRGKSSFKVTLITHRGSHQIYPEYYSNIKRIAMSYLSTKEVNIATLSKFEKTWSANIARNIWAFSKYPGANIFYDKFKGVPAIVAAAGPSLTESIDFIKGSRDRAVIVAVDTSYKILKKNGIEPHFCVTVDPQVINARYFEGDVKGKTMLIADPTVHPSVFRLFKGNIALIGIAFEMMKWIEKITGENGELAYGGSVSTNAYDFARRLGASPVVMVGQDLAFTGGLAHARGSYLDEEVRLRLNRFYNAFMFNRFQLTALPKIYVDGIDGNKVQTNQKMMIFLSWFEKRNDPNLINATFNGAVLKGIRHEQPGRLVFNDTGHDIFSTIYGIYSQVESDSPRGEKINNELSKKCGEILKDLKPLLETLERAVTLSEEMSAIIKNRKKGGRLDYILNKLSDADKLISSRDTLKDMISFTIQRVIHTINEGYEIDGDDSAMSNEELVAKRSQFLYSGLYEGALFNKKILNNMISLLGG